MYRYQIFLRKAEPVGTLEIIEDFCEAKSREEAQRIFEERHGFGRVVAGPNRIPDAQSS